MHIYTIHRVLNVRYWQTVEKLPHRYRNALEHRYEKVRRQLAIVTFALMLVALVVISVNIHTDDPSVETLMVYAMIIVMIIGVSAGASLWNLRARHTQTLRYLASDPEEETGLMSESNPIFRYIMSRDLITWLEGRNPNITEVTRKAFLVYLAGARSAYHSYLAMRRDQAGSTKTQQIDAEYECNLRLIDLAEIALKKIDPQFHIEHVDHCYERRAAALAKRDEDLRAHRVQQETEARSARQSLSL